LLTDKLPGGARRIRPGPHAARQIVLLVTTCLIGLGFGLARPGFLSLGNFLNIGLQTAVISIIAFAMTCVIVAKGIDLSVGSTVAVAGVVGALALQAGWTPLLGLVVILLVGLAVGALNGFLVTVIGVSPFIATLGTLALGRGASLSLSDASSIDVGQPLILWFGSARVLGMPVSVVLALLLLLGFWFLLNRTVFGRWIFAVGGNAEAARASTIPVRWTQFLTYLLTGIAAGVGSVVTLGRLGSAQPLAGEGLEFAAITAVIVGGTKLSGGEGSILSTFLGATLVAVITAGLSFIGVRQEITYVITGVLILLAVLSNRLEALRPARWFARSGGRQIRTEEAE
jgi:ribose transport system ATP-binding protein